MLTKISFNFPDITIVPDVTQAVAHALEAYRPKEAICIAGSLYVVGEAKEAFEKGLIPSLKKIWQ